MKQKKYLGKTLEEVELLAPQELGIAKEDLYFDVISPEGTPVENMEIEVICDVNPVKKGKDFLEEMLKNADIYGFVERKMRDDVVEYAISTDDANGALIGSNSQTLNALQLITSLVVNQYFDRENEAGLIVKVDIDNYRRSRDEKLEKLALRVAREVAKTKIPVKLRSMNSYERKVIHNKLSDWRDVTTHSEGVEPDRYVIIEPRKKENKQEEQE